MYVHLLSFSKCSGDKSFTSLNANPVKMQKIKMLKIQKIKILRRSLLRSRETARSEQCVLHGCRSIRDLEMKKEDRRGTPEKFKILRSELR